MDRKSYFPTPVYRCNLDDKWRAELLDDIREWSSETGTDKTNRGESWHSDTDALKRPAFSGLLADVVRCGTEVIEQERYQGGSRIRVTDMWANILRPGGYHVPHTHLDSHWSGVFHASCPPGSGKLVLIDPRQGMYPLGNHDHTIEPVAGQLIIFPAWLSHYVELQGGKEPRVSVSFNLLRITPARKRACPPFVVVKDVLGSADIQAVYAAMPDQWRRGTTFNLNNSDYRNNDVLFLDAPRWGHRLRWLHDRIASIVSDMNRKHFGRDMSGGAQSYQMARYAPGQKYGEHIDVGGSGSSTRRTLTCVITLRNAERGGGTGFPRADTQPDAGIGDAVIFAADEPHEGLPVEAGTRDALVSWFLGA